MAKPVICDRCGEVVSEERIVQKPKYLWPPDEYVGIKVEFVKSPNKADADVCRKCGGEVIIELGKDIEETLREAKEQKREFAI